MSVIGKVFQWVLVGGIVFWLILILKESTPMGRINQTCAPVDWIVNASGNVVGVMSSDWGEGWKTKGKNVGRGCRFFIFRQFYAEEWARQRAVAGEANRESSDTSRQ